MASKKGRKHSQATRQKIKQAALKRWGDQEARFWSHVYNRDQEGECWPWTGTTVTVRNLSRGILRWDSIQQQAHRVAWQITHGPIPAGSVIYHTCDNPICVNVKHLRCGTQANNIKDMVAKDRQRFSNLTRGERNPNAKLTKEAVAEIRQLAAEGIPRKEIAVKFNISRGHTNNIIRRVVWKHI